MLYDIPAHDIMFGSDPQEDGYFWVDIWGQPRQALVHTSVLIRVVEDAGVGPDDTCIDQFGNPHSWDEVLEDELAYYL